MDSLILIAVANNESQPFPVDEIVNEYFPQPVETVEDGNSDLDEGPDEPIPPPLRDNVDEEFEILNRLTLSTTDLDLDLLPLKVSNKINQRRLDRMKRSSISDFFKKNSNCSIVILIFPQILTILLLRKM